MLVKLNKKETGFSLIELMIAMSLGLIVVGGAISVFLATSNSNRDVLNAMRLNQELRGVMSFVVRDLRRAGSWNYTATIAADATKTMSDNPFNQITGTPNCDPTISGLTAAQGGVDADADGVLECIYECVEYTYDYPEDVTGVPDGVRNADGTLNADGTPKEDADNSERFGFGFEDDVIKLKKSDDTCAAGMVGWEAVTDDKVVKITNFQVIDRFPKSYGGAQTRLLEIRITGELVKDSTVSRDLVDYVRIRNDYSGPLSQDKNSLSLSCTFNFTCN
jgi:prepilin peptidase dependent protein B